MKAILQKRLQRLQNKSMGQYKNYLDRISIDPDRENRIINDIVHKSKYDQKKKRYWNTGWVAGVALCIVCVCVTAVRLNTGHKMKTQSESIIGLPVENYSLSDYMGDTSSFMDRIVFSQLSDFAEYSGIDAFVYVKVLDTSLWKEEGIGLQKQHATVKVLSTLDGNKTDIPNRLTIIQSLYGGCVGNEQTNLVRKGGVYVLPIWNTENGWEVVGDLDVLFEIDDKGKIWSHSSDREFAKFDGLDHSAVKKELNELKMMRKTLHCSDTKRT